MPDTLQTFPPLHLKDAWLQIIPSKPIIYPIVLSQEEIKYIKDICTYGWEGKTWTYLGGQNSTRS